MSEDHAAPAVSADGLERLLTELWEEVLGIPVGPEQNFFSLGGDSIKAVQVVNRLQERMDTILHPASVFDAPTVAALAAYCRTHYPAVFSAEGTSPSPKRLTEEQIERARQRLLRRNCEATLPAGIDSPRNPPAVFILAPPRSGTTLLRVMLAGHPGLFCPPELYLLSFSSLGRRVASFSGRRGFFRDGLIRALMALRGCDVDQADDLLRELEGRDLSTKDMFRRLQDWAGDRLVVDKTPSYALNPDVLRRAEQEFTEARFIHLVRHPMACIGSFEEIRADLVTGDRDEELGHDARQLGELWWLISQRNILAFLATIPAERQLRLSYEDLVQQPMEAMQRVCAFLGLGYHADMLQPYQSRRQRMTDGPRPDSRMLGDQKFHAHGGIDAGAAQRWREKFHEDFLCEGSWDVAGALGYERERFADAEREEWEI